MKIIIFGGTTEGRELSVQLASEGADVTVSVASEYGAEEQTAEYGIQIEEGLKDEDEMRLLIRGADLCVDATHPYAVLVTENIQKAAAAEGVELLRLTRDAAKLEELQTESSEVTASAGPNAASDIIIAGSAEEAAHIAVAKGGRVLLTTGSKDLQIYADAIDPERLYPRVLPLATSLAACEAADIPHRNIIAAQGPFSEDFNRALIHEFDINILITKESGKAGGFGEKIQAAKDCGIPTIVIARPAEEGHSYDEVLALCRRKMQ